MADTCKETLWGDTWSRGVQCSRKATTPDGFCTQHSPEKKAERRAKSEARYEEERLRRQAIYDNAKRLNAKVSDLTGHTHAVVHYSGPYGPDSGQVVVDVGALELLIEQAAQ